MNLGEIKTSEFESKYLRYGINNNVMFLEAEGIDEPELGSPKIILKFVKQNADDYDTQNTAFQLSFPNCNIKEGIVTENVLKYTLPKIKHLVHAQLGKEADFEFNSLHELAQTLNRLLKDKVYSEFKLSGEEYINSNNELKIKTVIPLVPFCIGPESTNTYLKYDINNMYDMKRMVAIPKTEDQPLI